MHLLWSCLNRYLAVVYLLLNLSYTFHFILVLQHLPTLDTHLQGLWVPEYFWQRGMFVRVHVNAVFAYWTRLSKVYHLSKSISNLLFDSYFTFCCRQVVIILHFQISDAFSRLEISTPQAKRRYLLHIYQAIVTWELKAFLYQVLSFMLNSYPCFNKSFDWE